MLDERGNRILWGWIPETRPEAEYRAAGWAGVMALPRALSIGTDGRLDMTVARAVEMLRRGHTQVRNGLDQSSKEKALAKIRIRDLAAEIHARFAAGRGFRLRLRSETGEAFAEVVYDPQRKDAELRVNTTTGTLATKDPISLRMFLDGSVLEVFVNEKTVITARVYTVPTGALLVGTPEVEALESFDVWGMKAISADRLTG